MTQSNLYRVGLFLKSVAAGLLYVVGAVFSAHSRPPFIFVFLFRIRKASTKMLPSVCLFCPPLS